MRTYRVAIVNTILNFRRIIYVEGHSQLEAGAAARQQLGQFGYDKLESIACVAN